MLKTLLKVLRIAAMVFLGLLVALILFLAYAIWYFGGGIFGDEDFEPVKWQAGPSATADRCYRGGMAKDIRDRIVPKGMSRNQVERVLGKPDQGKSSEYRYVLGKCSGLGIDYDDLHIYFDEQGVVVNVLILQH